MREKIEDILGSQKSVAEICTGAYGYLSASVDLFLHDPAYDRNLFESDFRSLQRHVTAGIQRCFQEKGLTMIDLVGEIEQIGHDMGLSEDELAQVKRHGLRLLDNIRSVTKP